MRVNGLALVLPRPCTLLYVPPFGYTREKEREREGARAKRDVRWEEEAGEEVAVAAWVSAGCGWVGSAPGGDLGPLSLLLLGDEGVRGVVDARVAKATLYTSGGGGLL